MKLKGVDKFREKLPALAGKKIIILPLYFITIIIITVLAFSYFDLFEEYIPMLPKQLAFHWFPIHLVKLMRQVSLFA